ncbi:unnamed protein product [Rhizophagus irregularis]|nr:unnamed protein product [Rhizophagus irregularis]
MSTEEQEAFHSQPYDFEIPNNIEDLNLPKDQEELIKDLSKLELDKLNNGLGVLVCYRSIKYHIKTQ